MLSRRAVVLLAAVTVASTVIVSPAMADTSAPAGHSGTLSNGSTWTARVPEHWNGSVVLYSHGYNGGVNNPAVDAPNEATAQALLTRGFALAGSSYAHTGWALDTAVQDQLDTVRALTRITGKPRQVIAFGQSMGGLVSALLAEHGQPITGAFTTCGLVGGALNLNNYQFDGTYAAARLLLPGQDVQLTGFTTVAEANATVDVLTAAIHQAQTSPAGRARVALAATLMNMPTWSTGDAPPTDWEAQQQAQYEWMVGILRFVLPARVTINALAGGDSSWNAGVDYRALIARSEHFAEVAGLYRQAGQDLDRDLRTLNQGATTTPNPAAVRWLARTSTPTGHLSAPELNIHTISDFSVPPEFQTEYAGKVARAHDSALLRQAYISRIGHCAFTPAELVAGLLAVHNRVRTGTWGTTTSPESLQRSAQALDLGPAAYIRYQPGPFVNDRADYLVH